MPSPSGKGQILFGLVNKSWRVRWDSESQPDNPQKASQNLAVEECFEAGVAGAADWELGAGGEDGDVGVFTVGFDFGDAFEIDDEGTVDAHEASGIE
jgi:hypothetical protein